MRDEIEVTLAVLGASVNQVENDVREIRASLRADHVKRLEFEPVKSVVFGIVGTTLMAVIGSLAAVLIRQ